MTKNMDRANAVIIDADNYPEIFVDGPLCFDVGAGVTKVAYYCERPGLEHGDPTEKRIVLRLIFPTENVRKHWDKMASKLGFIATSQALCAACMAATRITCETPIV